MLYSRDDHMKEDCDGNIKLFDTWTLWRIGLQETHDIIYVAEKSLQWKTNE